MVVLDAALHILQLVQDCEHVDELAQGQEVGLRDEVLPTLSMAQPLHLTAEPLDGLALQAEGGGESGCGSPVGQLTARSGGEQGRRPLGPCSEPGHSEKGQSARRSLSEVSLNPKLTSGGKPGTFPHGSQTNEFIHHAFAEKHVLFTLTSWRLG